MDTMTPKPINRDDHSFPENEFGAPEIPSGSLSASMVPSLNAKWLEICQFALTYDGYRHTGSTNACAELANSTRARHRSGKSVPGSLDHLRTCLFFEQRRFHHFGHEPEGSDFEYVQAIVLAIRKKVASRSPSKERD
jgi:hypothetical protein